MKVLLFIGFVLILLTNYSFSQIIVEQDFDGASSWGYSSSVTYFSHQGSNTNNNVYPLPDGWADDGFYGIISMADATGLDYAPLSGNILGERDLDDEGDFGTGGDAVTTFSSVNVSGCSNVEISFDYDIEGYNANSDEAFYEVFLDGVGQGRVTLQTGSTSGDNAEGTVIYNVPGGTSSIALEIIVNNNGTSGYSGFDNFLLTGTCGPPTSNTITTGVVSPLSYTVDCSNGQTGTVNFTSTDVYNGGNVFTAELSDASGSFATPTSIGTLTASGANPSGSINFTIPAATITGNGYRIRIVSSDPVIIGTDNGSDITISLTGGPCTLEPPHATSMIINSCNTSCGEGNNEVIFGNTGDYSILMNSTNFELTYGSFPSPTNNFTDPLVTNTTTTSALNDSSNCPGLFIDATNTTIPPNATFMLAHEAICPGDVLDFSNLCGSGPIYIIYTQDVSWNLGGNFVNSTGSGIRYMTTTITSTDGTTHVIDYSFDSALNSGTDGDYAKWDFNGGLAIEQGNNGCTVNPVVLPVDLVDLSLSIDHNNSVMIDWITSSETNNESFIIYHSQNGKLFEAIETIQGAGNSTTRLSYSVLHNTPAEGINYYLLRSTDFDGTTYTKSVKAINVEKSIVYFDYATHLLHLPMTAKYQILSIEGRVVEEVIDKEIVPFTETGVFIVYNLDTGRSYKVSIQ